MSGVFSGRWDSAASDGEGESADVARHVLDLLRQLDAVQQLGGAPGTVGVDTRSGLRRAIQAIADGLGQLGGILDGFGLDGVLSSVEAGGIDGLTVQGNVLHGGFLVGECAIIISKFRGLSSGFYVNLRSRPLRTSWRRGRPFLRHSAGPQKR